MLWYRYEDQRFAAPLDEFENPIGETRVALALREYPVLRTTPSGVWLDVYGQERFVKAAARKRFACPTKEEALVSFQARKQRQLRILESQVRLVKKAIYMSNEFGPVMGKQP